MPRLLFPPISPKGVEMRCSDQSLKIQRCRTTGERPPRLICPHLSVRRERLQFVKAGWPAILCLEPTAPPESPPYYCAVAQRPATTNCAHRWDSWATNVEQSFRRSLRALILLWPGWSVPNTGQICPVPLV